MTYTANYLRTFCSLCLIVYNMISGVFVYACFQDTANSSDKANEAPTYEIDLNEAAQVHFSGCIVPLSYAQEAIEALEAGIIPLDLQFNSTELKIYKEEKKQDPIVTIIRMEHRGDFKVLPHSYVEYLVENVYPFSSTRIPNFTRNLNVSNLDPVNEPVKYWVFPSHWFSSILTDVSPCPVRIRDIKWVRLDTDTKLFK